MGKLITKPVQYSVPAPVVPKSVVESMQEWRERMQREVIQESWERMKHDEERKRAMEAYHKGQVDPRFIKQFFNI